MTELLYWWRLVGSSRHPQRSAKGTMASEERACMFGRKPDFFDLIIFIMTVEETFGIYFPDADAEKIRTPRDLKRYLESRLYQGPGSPCLSQRCFYRLRQALSKVLSTSRDLIRPGTKWKKLLPWWKRRRLWEALGKASGLPLPTTKPQFNLKSLQNSLAASMIYLVIATFCLWNNEAARSSSLIWLLIGIVAILIFSLPILAGTIKPAFENWVEKRHFKTIGSSAVYLASTAACKLKEPGEGWSRKEISGIVDRLIVEVIGVKKFSDESRFFGDLCQG
ncbi:MAG: acyl carrier protein [Planctomycetes bacterium]|nr:acyl carrier protein [Planctomycetota bacterium]